MPDLECAWDHGCRLQCEINFWRSAQSRWAARLHKKTKVYACTIRARGCSASFNKVSHSRGKAESLRKGPAAQLRRFSAVMFILCKKPFAHVYTLSPKETRIQKPSGLKINKRGGFLFESGGEGDGLLLLVKVKRLLRATI